MFPSVGQRSIVNPETCLWATASSAWSHKYEMVKRAPCFFLCCQETLPPPPYTLQIHCHSCRESVWFIDGSATVRTAVVLKHQEFIVLTVKHLQGNRHIIPLQQLRHMTEEKIKQCYCKNYKILHLEAGGAHGDAHIWQQGAEVFPLERPGPAFDQDVPPAHGAQRRATHLDGDKVGAPLLLGHTETHPCFNMDPSFHLVQLVEY